MKSLISVLIISSVLLLSIKIQAVQKDSSKIGQKVNIANIMANKLQQKILLSDSQTSQVAAIINSYLALKVKTDNDAKSSLEKVVSFLDKRQKAKYDIIKDDWWSYLAKYMNK